MRTINNITIVMFSIFSIASIVAIFFKAYHHIGTLIISILMIVSCALDNKEEN